MQYSDEVLSCFASYRLDDVKVSQKKLEQQQQMSSQSYFAKYLTSEKVCLVSVCASMCNCVRMLSESK